MITTTYEITGMTCPNCEAAVCRAARTLPGVQAAKADYLKGRLWVQSNVPLDWDALKAAVETAGYGLAEQPAKKRLNDFLCLLIILAGLYVIACQLGLTELFQRVPVIDSAQIGYLALFLIGLLTSVHCVAMCGGINLSQSMADNKGVLRGSLLYNLGRLTGYTLIGGLLGALGNAVSITLEMRSIIGLVAGTFMVLMGINMAGEFHVLRRLTPRLPAPVVKGLNRFGRHGAFAIGLANALMPCGPLQSMQLYAISSGGFVRGALSMLCFCLGTIPLVLGAGVTAKVLQRKWQAAMLKVSAVLLVLFGVFMVQNNLALSGITLPGSTSGPQAVASVVEGDKQTVTTILRANGYDDLELVAGLPTEWTIIVEDGTLNGCNSEIVLPVADQKIPLQQGETVITIPALEPGSYTYSCWMGMLRNTITVV